MQLSLARPAVILVFLSYFTCLLERPVPPSPTTIISYLHKTWFYWKLHIQLNKTIHANTRARCSVSQSCHALGPFKASFSFFILIIFTDVNDFKLDCFQILWRPKAKPLSKQTLCKTSYTCSIHMDNLLGNHVCIWARRRAEETIPPIVTDLPIPVRMFTQDEYWAAHVLHLHSLFHPKEGCSSTCSLGVLLADRFITMHLPSAISTH